MKKSKVIGRKKGKESLSCLDIDFNNKGEVLSRNSDTLLSNGRKYSIL